MAEITDSDSTAPEGLADLRIALAMSGAIALVLYESGVANEICNFVNAEGPYRDAIDDSKLRPIVDILTGASAGGINSVFLANCFANGAKFECFTDIWIQNASVDALQYGAADSPASVLDTTSLKTSMGAIMLGNIKPTTDPRYSDPDDLRVRLCRTDLRGYNVNTIDAAGHSIGVTSRSDVVAYDLRTFQDKAKVPDVVEAAAATSAFPLAFPPVFNNGRWYVDGGLWDNQPIDLAVEAIRDKPAYNRSHRCVYFIDPDPSVLKSDDDPSMSIDERKKAFALEATQQAKKPPTALEALAFLPGMGIKGDVLPALESILEYNRRCDLYRLAIGIPTFGNPATRKTIADEFEAPNVEGVDDYDKLSLLTKVRIETVLFDSDPKLIEAWSAIRQRDPDLANAATQPILDTLNSVGEADIYRRAIRRVIADLNKELSKPKTNVDKRGFRASERQVDKKSLYLALKAINEVLEAEPNPVDDLDSGTLTFREHLRAQVSRFRFPSETIIARLTKEMGTGKAPSPELFSEWSQAGPDPSKVRNAVEQAMAALADIPGGPDRDQDVLRYVLAGISDLDEKGRIDLIRISPNDADNADLIGGTPAAGETLASFKLAGKGLGHMQGFFEERWRRNDYIWGRLDAAQILLGTLQTYAEREARASGSVCIFTKTAYDAALCKMQDWILQQEAKNYDPRAKKGTNTAEKVDDKVCGAVMSLGDSTNPSKPDANRIAAIQTENRKLIGYGSETLADAIEPQFSKNVEYIASVLPKMFRGSASKPPALLDQFARISRVLSYAMTCLSWLFPFKPYTVRAKVIRGAAIVAVGTLIWLWGFRFGQGGKIEKDLVNGGLAVLGAWTLVSLGAALGYRFSAALYSMLAIGLLGGYEINEQYKFVPYNGKDYPVVLVMAALLAVISLLLLPFAFAKNDRPPSKGTLQRQIEHEAAKRAKAAPKQLQSATQSPKPAPMGPKLDSAPRDKDLNA